MDITKLNSLSADEAKSVLFPEMSLNYTPAAPEMANTLASAAGLWSVISEKSVDACSTRLAAIDKLTSDVSTTVSMGSVLPVVNVEVISSMGQVQVNTSDHSGSNIANAYVPVQLKEFSLPFHVTMQQLAQGVTLQNKINAAMNVIAQGVIDEFVAVVKAANATAVEVEEITPEVVAKQISPIFGDAAEVENLVLSTTAIAGLVPTNALGFRYNEENVYGCHYISTGSGIAKATATNDALGIALAADGVVAAYGMYNIKEIEQLGGMSLRQLGSIAGVPVMLKAWQTPGQSLINMAVIALAGFAVSDKKKVRVITPAE